MAVPIPAIGTPPSKPSGVLFNPISQDFLVRGTPAQFLFTTEDGTVSTWSTINGNNPSTAFLAVDDSASGAIYKGLDIVNPGCCREYLALADFDRGIINTYDVNFVPLAILRSFKDFQSSRWLRSLQHSPDRNPGFRNLCCARCVGSKSVTGPGNGIVDVFDQEGTFIRRFQMAR